MSSSHTLSAKRCWGDPIDIVLNQEGDGDQTLHVSFGIHTVTGNFQRNHWLPVIMVVPYRSPSTVCRRSIHLGSDRMAQRTHKSNIRSNYSAFCRGSCCRLQTLDRTESGWGMCETKPTSVWPWRWGFLNRGNYLAFITFPNATNIFLPTYYMKYIVIYDNFHIHSYMQYMELQYILRYYILENV